MFGLGVAQEEAQLWVIDSGAERAPHDIRPTFMGDAMDIEDIKAEIGILLTGMQRQPEDRHELYLQLMERLNEMKAYGMPLPADLVKLESELEAEFAADKPDSSPDGAPG